jgi:hypothetical protein
VNVHVSERAENKLRISPETRHHYLAIGHLMPHKVDNQIRLAFSNLHQSLATVITSLTRISHLQSLLS